MSDKNASELKNIEPSPGSPKPDPILKVNNVVRSFGGLRAVDIDHLEGYILLESLILPVID